MSFSNFLSGLAGAFYGFLQGGPPGAAVGFIIGFGMSVAADALAPDMPSPGQPQTSKLNFPSADEGINIPDVLGTTKLSGNFFQYFGNRKVEVKEETGGKGGGGEEVVTGYKYFLSFAMGICLGPVDYLYAVYVGDDLLWSGALERPAGGLEIVPLGDDIPVKGVLGAAIQAVAMDAVTSSTNPGNMYFYFGTDNQPTNSKMAGNIPNTPPYRGLCFAFFDDNYIGGYNRVPSIRFIVGKFPQLAFNENETIDDYDYNPSHAIWYIMTHDLMANLPEEFMDEITFSGVADVLLTEERGVSILFDRQQTSLAYIETILNHVGGIMQYGCDSNLADE